MSPGRNPSLSLASMASRYFRWLTVLGATRFFPRGCQTSLQEVVAQVDERVLCHQIAGRFHVRVGQLETVPDQRRELADDAIDLVDAGRLAIDQQIAALRPDLDVEQGLEAFEVL